MQDDVSCFVLRALESNRKHGEVTEDNIKTFVVNEDICMGSEFFWKPEDTQNHIPNITGC